jgi:hypothetical protein
MVETVRVRLEDELTLINRLISDIRRDSKEEYDDSLSPMLIRLEKAREQLVRALIYANEDFQILPRCRDNADYVFILNMFVKYLAPEEFIREFSFGDFKSDLLLRIGNTWGFMWVVNEPEECFSLIQSLHEFLEKLKDYKKSDPIVWKLKIQEKESGPFKAMFVFTKEVPINILEEVQSRSEEKIVMKYYLLDLEKFPHMIMEPLI